MSIAVVSLACRYPEANDPAALWNNVLCGRRAFRALPPQRLDLDQYTSALVGKSDSITRVKAGILADWTFDYRRYRIPQQTFEAADLTHWLALDVAAEAIARAGGAEQFDRVRTAVVVANSLTGEFSRASSLRLRAPFFNSVLCEALDGSGCTDQEASEIRRRFAAILRARLPTPQEDTLAGALANTIAGRVANYFDFHGGAYTVDGACASSLVAVSHAVDLLARGDIDTVVVGGVDLSLDPMELVGFSRNGALAADDMRVFDRRSAGFWPGEGAGFAVVTRATDARRRALRILALIRGCGMSTDGAGGFTRPSVDGQLLALQRAHARGGTDPADLGYVEAHGTGTAVGDPVEVRALATLRADARARSSLAIGSIKANIGHTKAAAGFAGLIKAVAALQAHIIPPHVSCSTPHPVFAETDDRVRPALAAEPWTEHAALLAGVSAFGFGGINAHVVLEGCRPRPARIIMPAAPRPQNAELFIFGGEAADVAAKMRALEKRSRSLSLAELTDAAAHTAAASKTGPLRAGVVAGDGEELAARLVEAVATIDASREILDGDGIAAAHGKFGRLGFLFPGQGAPVRTEWSLWARRFDGVRDLLDELPVGGHATDTRIAQPNIVAASLAALRIVRAFGLNAGAVCGHSVGELTALACAGALDETDVVGLAAARGSIMADHAAPNGGMLRIGASRPDVERLIEGLSLVVACDNGARESVVAGCKDDLETARRRAEASGHEVSRLAVSHAFHSPMLAAAIAPFKEALAAMTLRARRLHVFSTVKGRILMPKDDVADLLARQIVAPVLFAGALHGLSAEADLLLELGPGTSLTRLARQAGCVAASVDACADTLRPLLGALGLAHVHGHSLDTSVLFADRGGRPIDLSTQPEFLRSPCAYTRPLAQPITVQEAQAPLAPTSPSATAETDDSEPDLITAVRRAIGEETGFAPDQIQDDHRFLDDLHLSSIAVGRIVSKAAQAAGIRIPAMPTEFANGNAREVVAGLAALRDLAPVSAVGTERLSGIRPWVRCFAPAWHLAEPGPGRRRDVRWRGLVVAGGAEDRRRALRLGHHADAADGLLVWIGDGADEQIAAALFAACRPAWHDATIAHLAICHAGAPVSAFARSLAAERRFRSITVIERPCRADQDERLAEELTFDAEGLHELRLDDQGRAWMPQIRLAAPIPGAAPALGAQDVVLVTGGAKGIGAECALRTRNPIWRRAHSRRPQRAS